MSPFPSKCIIFVCNIWSCRLQLTKSLSFQICRTGSKMFERDLRLWAKEKKCVCPRSMDDLQKLISLKHFTRYAKRFEIRQFWDVSCFVLFRLIIYYRLKDCRTRRRDSKRYYPKSEREVFDILGLEWIDPTLRNANA